MERQVALLIPAYKPSDALLHLIEELYEDIALFVIVSDGNDKTFAPVLNAICQKSKCRLVRHGINLGKGRALKTGFNEILNILQEEKIALKGVVTADADGQHLASDILKIADKTCHAQNSFVLGARDFSLKQIPLRSKIGNTITSKVFALLCGIRLSDTQTGLRGFGLSLLPLCIKVAGEGYEYETNFILKANEDGIAFEEVPITTVYENNNESSHFNPILDSFKIYRIIFKYTLSSCFSAVIDFIIFSALISMDVYIMLATYIARVFSAIVNFFTNRKIVFKSHKKLTPQIVKYALLCFFSGTISGGGYIV